MADLDDLTEIRTFMEGNAAERAAVWAASEERAAIEVALKGLKTAAYAGDIEGHVENNWRFHSGIYRASRLRFSVPLIESM